MIPSFCLSLPVLGIAATTALAARPHQKQGLAVHAHEQVLLDSGQTCTVNALGDGQDDTPAILAAVDKCGIGGTIELPDANYTISQRLTIHLENATLDLYGWLSFTPDIDYWRENSYRFPFQNQSIAFHVTGNDFVVDGHGTGGIFGNGQVWYSWNKGVGNTFGRPMSISITNATRAHVVNFSVVQPQFWASLVWNSEDVLLKNWYVNATNLDPAAAGDNWVVNTDGSDTYRSRRVVYEDWVYEGGDDCIAFKANSSEVTLRNITCHGASGIAFGSVGQYPNVTDIIEDIVIEDLNIVPGHLPPWQAFYFKSWIGVNIGSPPNGGGGGQGYCRNVSIRDVQVDRADLPILLISDLHYDAVNMSYANTSTYKWDDIHISNVSGTSAGSSMVKIDCSSKAPCTGRSFEDIDLKPADGSEGEYICIDMVDKEGLPQCVPP